MPHHAGIGHVPNQGKVSVFHQKLASVGLFS